MIIDRVIKISTSKEYEYGFKYEIFLRDCFSTLEHYGYRRTSDFKFLKNLSQSEPISKLKSRRTDNYQRNNHDN